MRKLKLFSLFAAMLIATSTWAAINCTTADIGKVICTDGTVYAPNSVPSGKTKAAMIGYVDMSTRKGLAVALVNAPQNGNIFYSDAVTTASNFTPAVPSGNGWRIPLVEEWQKMFCACATGSDDTTPQSSMTISGFQQKLGSCGESLTQGIYYWETDNKQATNKKLQVWGYTANLSYLLYQGYVRPIFDFDLPITSTVTFNKQGGTGGTASVTAANGSAMPAATMPTRTGYTFNGYFDATSGGTKYYNANGSSARTWNKTANTTLYAQWTANKYTVTFDRRSGSGGAANVSATYAAAMPKITVPSRTGYTFQGYYTEANGNGTKYYDANGNSAKNWDKTSNATLYAQWTVNQYTVTLDRNGGTDGSANVSATFDAAMPAATMPARTGYTFQGYYDAQTGGNQYYKADGSSARTWDKAANTTLYARWAPITYTITYDYAKGKGNNPATYNPDMATFDLVAPPRLGYTFLGWTGSNGETKQPIVTITTGSVGDKHYVAHWELNPNTHVSYLDSLDYTVGDEMSTFNRPIEPEIAGFTFVTWEAKEGPLSEGITLQAIYTEDEPSGAPKKQVGKFTLIRRGDKNEYILQTAK